MANEKTQKQATRQQHACCAPHRVDERDAQRSALLFKALGDPTRLKLAVALMGGPICVGDLAAHLGVGQSAVSHHLRILRNLSLVKARRDRQNLYYRLSDHHVEELIQISLEHVREGDEDSGADE